MPRERLGPRRLLGDEQLIARDLFLQRGVFGREGDIDPARDHADRCAAERADVRGGVDPARQPADHRDLARGEIGGELAREAARDRRCVARTDDGDARAAQHRGVAAHDDHGRRALDLAQHRRIIILVAEDVPRSERRDPLDLALGDVERRDPRPPRPAPQHEVGQGLERGLARPEPRHQLMPADRPDMRRTDQPQPRQPLRVSHLGPLPAPTRGSVPARSRAIFSRCRHSIITASPASPIA